jgi:hypothetical protein
MISNSCVTSILCIKKETLPLQARPLRKTIRLITQQKSTCRGSVDARQLQRREN